MNATDPHDLTPRLVAALDAIPAARFLGIHAESAERGRVVISLPMRPELAEHTGIFQGGIIGAMVDFAGAAACGTLLDVNGALQTLDYTVKLLAPANGKRLFAVGRVLNDHKQTILSAQVSVHNDSVDGPIVASGLVSTRVHKQPS